MEQEPWNNKHFIISPGSSSQIPLQLLVVLHSAIFWETQEHQFIKYFLDGLSTEARASVFCGLSILNQWNALSRFLSHLITAPGFVTASHDLSPSSTHCIILSHIQKYCFLTQVLNNKHTDLRWRWHYDYSPQTILYYTRCSKHQDTCPGRGLEPWW